MYKDSWVFNSEVASFTYAKSWNKPLLITEKVYEE